MKQKWLLGFTIFGIIWCIVLGVFGQYFYEWSGRNTLVGWFFAKDESVWQHMKLLFFPFLVYSILTLLFLKDKFHAVYLGSALSMVIALFFIPVAYRSYVWMAGRSIMWLDVTIFIISTVIACGGTALYAHRHDEEENGISMVDDVFAAVIYILLALTFIMTSGGNPGML